MLIGGVPIGAKVELMVERGKQIFNMESSIQDEDVKGAKIALPFYDGEHFVFHVGDKIAVLYNKDGRLLRWDCDGGGAVKDNIALFRLLCNSEHVSFNRREAYRLPVRTKSLMKLAGGGVFRGIIKDVSTLGIGVNTDEKLDKGQKFLVDLSIGACELSLEATVVRRMVGDSGNYVYNYGCVTKHTKEDALCKFIFDGQKNMLKASRGNN